MEISQHQNLQTIKKPQKAAELNNCALSINQ